MAFASVCYSGCPIPVAILGCTGVVGQRFIELLSFPLHPSFRIVAIAASERSSGREYGSLGAWKLERLIPPELDKMVVTDCSPESIQRSGAQLVFSALDAAVAGPIELALARCGILVFSNARNHRTNPNVPILVPYANAHHLSSEIIAAQRKKLEFPGNGLIVTNSNCSSAGLAVILRPIQLKFGISRVFVTTLQAVSGAGLPGVPSLSIIDNVIPFIDGEEEKVQTEPLKILGNYNHESNQFESASDIHISAMCHRVPVLDGHTESISIETQIPATIEEITACLTEFRGYNFDLPSSPEQPIRVFDSAVHPDRPQPRLDRWFGSGMTVSVGRIRKCNLFGPGLGWKMTLVANNTVLGAAGGSIQNAELAACLGLIGQHKKK